MRSHDRIKREAVRIGMLAYFIMMAGIIACVFLLRQYFGWDVKIFAFFVMVIFSGLRLGVGSDWFSYIAYYDYLVSGFATFGLFDEPLFSLLSIAAERSGVGIIGVNVVCAVIYFLGLFWLASKVKYPWLLIAAAFCYYVPALPMGIIRQSAAVGICYIVVATEKTLSLRWRVGLAVIAVGFHASAILVLGLLMLTVRIPRWRRGLLCMLAIGSAVFLNIGGQGAFALYGERYIGENATVAATGSLFHWALVAVPGLWYLWNWRNLKLSGLSSEIMLVGSLGSIALIVMLPFSSLAVTRLAMYFSFVPLVAVGLLPAMIRARIHRAAMTIWLAIVAFFVLATWLIFAENSNAYKPYRNILAEENSKIWPYL